MIVCRYSYRGLRRAVLFLQTGFRMRNCRQQYLIVHQSAIRIKSFLRMLTLSHRWKKVRQAVLVLQTRLKAFLKQRMRYQQLQRAVHTLHGLTNGLISRSRAQHVCSSLYRLQHVCKQFILRKHRKQLESVAILKLQRQWRGFWTRHGDKSIVNIIKILAFRKEQRLAHRVVKKLQSLWRGKLVNFRFQEVVSSTIVIQRWFKTRRDRQSFLKKKRLAIWLQSQSRRFKALQLVHTLRVSILLQQEQQVLNTCFKDEINCLHERKLSQCIVGSDYYLHGKKRFDRILIGFDISFDVSLIYPDGWLQTILGFINRCVRSHRCVRHIAIGANHTVIVDDQASVFTFGLGDLGQLGHSNRSSLNVIRPIEAMGKILGAAEDKKKSTVA
jgi:hypothetical protein